MLRKVFSSNNPNCMIFLHVTQPNFLFPSINQLYDDLKPSYLHLFQQVEICTSPSELSRFSTNVQANSNATFLLDFSVSEQSLGLLLIQFNKN